MKAILLSVLTITLLACPGPTDRDGSHDSGTAPDAGTADASTSDAGSPDAGARHPNAWAGEFCSADSNCQSRVCVIAPDASWGACESYCTSDTDCLPGWDCLERDGGLPRHCQCQPVAETCDGVDNDCNGLVDDHGPADALCAAEHEGGWTCEHGACTCLLECNGHCVDPTSDRNNCGACDHQCDECNNGTCITAYDVPIFARKLAADEDSIYWTFWSATHGMVGKVSLAGGAVTTLAAGRVRPWKVAVHDGTVYWLDQGDDPFTGMVLSVPSTGGTVTTIASGQNEPLSMVVDDTGVFWVASATKSTTLTPNLDGAIVSAPIGGSPVTLAAGLNGPRALALDSTNLYWSSHQTTSSNNMYFQSRPFLNWMPRVSGGDVMRSAEFAVGYCASIAADDDGVYLASYSTRNNITSWGDGALSVVAERQFAPYEILLDEDHLYWGNQGGWTPGSLVKVSRQGGAPTTLIFGQDMDGLAANSTTLFWADGSTRIRAAPKTSTGR